MKKWISAGVLMVLSAGAGCRSAPYIFVTVTNVSGEDVRNLEVDYPGASFGHDQLTNGAAYPYKFQPRGSGKVSAEFTDMAGKQHKVEGPMMSEGQSGTLDIRLTPGDGITFAPNFSGAGKQ